MAQQQPTAAWAQQMQSSNNDHLVEAASELGLQACKTGSAMDQVVSAASIPSLVALISSSDTKKQGHAISLLAGLSENHSNSSAIIEAGAVPTLVGLLRSDDLLVQNSAAMTLYGLAVSSSSNRAMMMAAGAIPLLQDLCRSDKLFVRLAAATALFRIASDHSQFGTLSATIALPTMIRMLTPCNRSSKARGSKAKGDVTQAAGSTNCSSITSDEPSNVSGRQEERADPEALSLERAAQVAVLVTLKDSLRDTTYRKGSMVQLLLDAGVPEALVCVLNTGSTAAAVQVYAIELMCEMMTLESGAASNIAAAGAIQALLPVLQSGKAGTYVPAATALYYLVHNSNNNKATFIRDNGLVVLKPLMGIPDKRLYAVQLLDALVSGGMANSRILSAAVAAGVIAPLVQLLQGSDAYTQHRAMSVLCTFARHSSSYQDAICTAGTIPELVSLLPYGGNGYVSAVLLSDLIQGNTTHKAALAAAGGIEAMIKALRSPDCKLQEAAAKLLLVMITSEGSYQSAAIAAGAIPALVSVLKGRNIQAQIEAAKTLANLAVPSSFLHFAADIGNQGMGNIAMLHTNIKGESSHKGAWHAAAEAVPVLVKLLEHNDVELLTAASSALSNMFNTSSAFAQAFEAADGLTAVVSMLNSGIHSVQVLALLLLKNYNKCTNFGRLE